MSNVFLGLGTFFLYCAGRSQCLGPVLMALAGTSTATVRKKAGARVRFSCQTSRNKLLVTEMRGGKARAIYFINSFLFYSGLRPFVGFLGGHGGGGENLGGDWNLHSKSREVAEVTWEI